MNESTNDSRNCEISDACNNLIQTILFAKLWVHERPLVSKRQNSNESVAGNTLEGKVSTSVGLN